MSDISGSVDDAIEAQAQAVRETRRNLISKLRDERRAHEEARERAEQARERFERTVAAVAVTTADIRPRAPGGCPVSGIYGNRGAQR